MEEEIQTTPEVTEPVNEDTPNLDGGETPETPQEPANQPDQPNPDEGIDYKAKFGESTRENQILQSKIKGYESRRELTNDPTETELRTAFPTWDFMSETEKDLARGQLKTQKKADAALAANQKRDEDEKWNNSLEFAITSNPDLQGKERQFKEFASKPTHRGAPVDVLVDAFLHKSSTPTTKSTPKQVLNTGSGGPKEPVKLKKISIEESAHIRKTNYKQWKELVDAGAIEELE